MPEFGHFSSDSISIYTSILTYYQQVLSISLVESFSCVVVIIAVFHLE